MVTKRDRREGCSLNLNIVPEITYIPRKRIKKWKDSSRTLNLSVVCLWKASLL